MDNSISVVTEDNIIEDLLSEWGCLDLLSDFKVFGIDIDVLKNISEDDIRDLIPRERLGLRVKFKQKLNEWREINRFLKTITGTSDTVSGSDSISSWILQTCTHPDSPTSSKTTDVINLKQLLTETFAGRAILTEYHSTHKLSNTSRGNLANTIVDYWISEGIKVIPNSYVQAVEEIKVLFPSEEKEVYYVPRLGNIPPRGKLIDKYYSRCRKFRKLGLIESKYKSRTLSPSTSTSSTSNFIFESDQGEDNDVEEAYNWLLHNRDPPEIVTEKWKLTFNKRKKDIWSSSDDIFQKWPTFKLPSGYIYVELDFEALHPGIDSLLFSKWNEFVTNIFAIFSKTIKDPSSKELLKTLKDCKSEDGRNFLTCRLLHAILIPRLVQVKKNNKKISWKPSIADAQDSFALHVTTYNCLSSSIERQTKKYKDLGASFQPCIIVVGEPDDPKEFYCYLNGITYSFPSFLKALSVSFKIHQVFNLEYAKECSLVWQFFENYFYNFKVTGKVNSALTALLADLKAE